MKPTLMKPTFNAVRAIGAEFSRRTLRPVVMIGAVVLAVLIALGGWLITVSPWWWLLEAPLLFGGAVFTVLVLIVRTAIRVADPPQTKDQKTAIRGYVDKLQRVAENLQTPQFIILYRVVRDIARPRPGGYIETVSNDSKSLAPDFTKLLAQFRSTG